MKINKLVMTGFGPYATRQELDFQENLDGENIFLVTGNTGAGKSTIFDAINFALFGEASGSERVGNSFRSDYADPDTPTEVELWFSVRGNEYYIKRSPEYERRAKRGDGTTTNKSAVELKNITENKLWSKTHKKEIDAEIINILGITPDQFRQLVMIPQGEFKKFLTSNSKEKLTLFRKIFGTQTLQRLEDSITSEERTLRNEFNDVKKLRDARLQAFKYNDNAELMTLLAAKDINVPKVMEMFEDILSVDEALMETEKTAKDVENIALEELRIIITKAEVNNANLDNLNKSKDKLQGLLDKKAEYDLRKIKLERANKAISIEGAEMTCRDNKALLEGEKVKVPGCSARVEDYKTRYKQEVETVSKEEANIPLRDKTLVAINELEAKRPKAEAYEAAVKRFETARASEEENKNAIRAAKAAIDKAKEIKVQLEVKSNKIVAAKERKSEYELKKADIDGKLEKFNTLKNYIERRDTLIRQHGSKVSSYISYEEDFNNKDKDHRELELQFFRNQAGILAQSLRINSPCPVCGSMEHPQPAAMENADINKAAVENSKTIAEQAKDRLNQVTNSLNSLKEQADNLAKDEILPLAAKLLNGEEIHVDNLHIKVEDAITTLSVKQEEIQGIIKAAQTVINEEADITRELEECNKEVTQKEALRESLVNAQDGLINERTVAETEVTNIIGEFGGQVVSVEVIDEELKEKKAFVEAADRKLATAISNRDKAKTYFEKEETNLQNINGNIENYRGMLQNAIAEFNNKIAAAGFADGPDYLAAKLDENSREVEKQAIEQYESDIRLTNTVLGQLREVTKDVAYTDIGVLKNKQNEMKLSIEAKENAIKDIYSRIKQNTDVIKDVKRYGEKISDKEERYKLIGKLSKLVSGDNSKKLKFESYVLASYFDDIIEAANQRLYRMTANRFKLYRQEAEGGRGQKGLELEVLDNYTGKKRAIQTLSGGESFKASLALALGFADVVQSNVGGIQMDTMFIDEGFGTLDEDSLDNAIECLVDLKNDGRLVGIISHVQELKDRIENKLVVTSTTLGSKAEFRK